MNAQTTARTAEVFKVGAGDNTMVFVSSVVKPILISNAKRAVFIVQACNAHDDLVAALRDAYGWMHEAITVKGCGLPFEQTLAKIRAALAKAGAL